MEPFVSQIYFGDLLRCSGGAGYCFLSCKIVASSVILDPARSIFSLTNSKKKTEKKRKALYTEIRKKALAYFVS